MRSYSKLRCAQAAAFSSEVLDLMTAKPNQRVQDAFRTTDNAPRQRDWRSIYA